MRYISGSLVLMLVALSCSSNPKEESVTVAASLQETSAPKSGPDCNDDTFCTREYIPTICQFSGQSFEGSNPCEAKKEVKRFACENKLTFADIDVSCKTKERKPLDTQSKKKGKG